MVNQPFYEETHVPKSFTGGGERTYFAPDCFHFAKKAHNAAGIALWNNIVWLSSFQA